ncbi:helix-turn-helix domain-containing protein [Gilliamella sp. App6-5]|uniref:helix-turn-helix domain-containing protein n=1 Tax=Gilliamella sp. App6-5 TaxID=3120232 RepID=UPI001C401004|nr:helix-turn-helix domain-containing protein [Gilliamella apicola]
MSPETVRRWFKKHDGITFQSYQRMYRINHAFQEFKVGKNVINTAYDTGYESLSGFGYTYKKSPKMPPLMSINQDIILINRLTTPLGSMFICSTNQGICLLEFVDRRILETEFE